MARFVVKHAEEPQAQGAPAWLVVDSHLKRQGAATPVASRHAFREEAEMEAQRRNGDDTSPLGSED
ncbi:hypothetical protein GCM10009038_31310 [Salinicola rhizosphaerae]|uniref:Uncharacterized protein n=1 Tax=Salinicola rhizosphaerae TaxID=1443141 RepID=A0ABQ3ECC0_9GAMM|nr:hypothetical protein GCM10009038_31310 [Salinicola rhizosphaerae]